MTVEFEWHQKRANVWSLYQCDDKPFGGFRHQPQRARVMATPVGWVVSLARHFSRYNPGHIEPLATYVCDTEDEAKALAITLVRMNDAEGTTLT